MKVSEKVAQLEAQLDELQDNLDAAAPFAIKWVEFCKRLDKGPHGEIEQVLEWAQQEGRHARDAAEWRTLCEMFAFDEKSENVVALDVFKAIEDDQKASMPRVITADELREGQWFAYKGRGAEKWNTKQVRGEAYMMGFLQPGDTIVLLADAPAEQAHAKETDTSPGHAKNHAEICNDEEAITATAETIRASEPGTTWKDHVGWLHEWTGERLAWHLPEGGLGNDDFLDEEIFEGDGPWSRSDTPPRGDYGKRDEQTIGDSIREMKASTDGIADEIYGTMFSDPQFLERLRAEIRAAKVVTDD